jgi:hypothetical protein
MSETERDTGWQGFYRRWPRLKPPLKPDADVCTAIRNLIAGHDEHALLLGVTPELAGLARVTVAVDWNRNMIRYIWPGDTDTRKAILGNWLHLPCAAGSISAAIGDGSLDCLDYPAGYHRIFAELARAMRPGARLAIRFYLTPEDCEDAAAVRANTLSGRNKGFHALKWRLANAIAVDRRDPNVPVREILRLFDRLFPDREALARATGWTLEEIAEIDAYAPLPAVFSFPTSRQVLDVVPDGFVNARFVAAGHYELATRCPILALERTP